MSALVEEAVTVGDLVRLFTFRQGNANLVELTLPDGLAVRRQADRADPVPRELRAGHDPARRPGLRPGRRAAGRGRRRAAVRRPRGRRGRARAPARPRPSTAARTRRARPTRSPTVDRLGVAARAPSALGAARSIGVRLRASSQTIGGERGELERPAQRDLEHAERRRRRCRRRSRPDWPASQIGAWTTTRARHGSDQHPGQPGAQPHHLLVLVPGGRVAGDAADHEADQRPADQARGAEHHGVAEVVEDARAGSTPAPGRPRCRRRWRRCGTNTPADRRSPNSALTTNWTVERCTSRTTSSDQRRRDARRSARAGCSLVVSQSDREQRASGPRPRSCRAGRRAPWPAGRAPPPRRSRPSARSARRRRSRRTRARSRDQLVARVVHDPVRRRARRSGPGPRSPGRARSRRSGAGPARPR